MKAAGISKTLVALKLLPGIHNVIVRGKTIVTEIGANPKYFPSPNPPLATVSAHIADLEAAEAVASTKVKGAVDARNVKLRIVHDDLHQLKACVQAAADADPGNAEAIITAATMSIRKTTTRKKTDFEAKQGAVSGSVRLIARAAARRASYDWQWSLDQKSWTDAPSTLQSRTTVANLSLGVVHYFRYRAVTKVGPGDWGQIASLLVS